MIGQKNLKIYNSFFKKTEKKNKIELYEFPDSKSVGVSYEKVRDETRRDFEATDNTASDIQDEILGPFVIEGYREQV